jgi:hypothetical protein
MPTDSSQKRAQPKALARQHQNHRPAVIEAVSPSCRRRFLQPIQQPLQQPLAVRPIEEAEHLHLKLIVFSLTKICLKIGPNLTEICLKFKKCKVYLLM